MSVRSVRSVTRFFKMLFARGRPFAPAPFAERIVLVPLNGRVLCQDELTLCVSISGLSCTLPTCLLVHRHHTTLTCCALVFIYLIVASGVFGLSCSVQTLGRGMWGLVPRPWIEPGTPASGGCLSCRATRAVPILSFKS